MRTGAYYNHLLLIYGPGAIIALIFLDIILRSFARMAFGARRNYISFVGDKINVHFDVSLYLNRNILRMKLNSL